MRIFKELLLRRDFFHSIPAVFQVQSIGRPRRDSSVRRSVRAARLSTAFPVVYNYLCLPSSSLFFFPLFLRGASFGGGALEGGEEAASVCARRARAGVSQPKPRDLLRGRQPAVRVSYYANVFVESCLNLNVCRSVLIFSFNFCSFLIFQRWVPADPTSDPECRNTRVWKMNE